MGNSEIVAKHALDLCRQNGADVKLLRLGDWDFSQCKGCFGCLLKDRDCELDDNLKAFADATLYGYDGVLVCAPTYQLSPPGIVKTIIDRVGTFVQKALKAKPRPLYGAVIGVAGVDGWDHFTMPMLTQFLKVITGFQAQIVGHALLHHPGPGEVLLSKESLSSIETIAARLARGELGEAPGADANGTRCPNCQSVSFIIRKQDPLTIECPFCWAVGEVAPNGCVAWDARTLTNNRFTEEAGRQFVESWILKTKGVFEGNIKEILSQKYKYKDSQIGISWEKP